MKKTIFIILALSLLALNSCASLEANREGTNKTKIVNMGDTLTIQVRKDETITPPSETGIALWGGIKITSIDPPVCLTDFAPDFIGYDGGDLQKFCKSKGFDLGYKPTKGCQQDCSEPCYNMPIQVLGHKVGHKSNLCRRKGFEGYKSGGEPGYCFDRCE